MDPISLTQVAQWAGGSLRGGRGDAAVSNVTTDSRSLGAGDFFVALRGERFDGHDFVPQAAQSGAAGALVEKFYEAAPPNFAQILVPDTLAGLQQLAGAYRRSLALRVVCITGSNGKTSTKDLTAAVLGERVKVTRTEGNLNNHIGLPLSLLRAGSAHQAGVFELGMNHPGEIAPLAALAAPEIGIVTNIGVAHIEFFGSREAIAEEKGRLAEALPAHGTLILNARDEFSPQLATRTKARVLQAGVGAGDVQARELQPHLSGTRFVLTAGGESVETELRVPGEHMVQNATLAAAAGLVLGLTLEECAAGLGKLALSKGRLEQKTARGVQILDDTYNANPDSMTAALRTLAQMPASGRRIAVLGRMGELGTAAEAGHRQVGEAAAEARIDCLVAVGVEALWTAEAAKQGGLGRVIEAESAEAATVLLRELVREGDLVLVKGSRSARMERIVEGLLAP